MRRLLLSRIDARGCLRKLPGEPRRVANCADRSLPLTSALGAEQFGTLDPADPIEEVLVKIDRLTTQERRVVHEALRVVVPACHGRVEGACAEALLIAPCRRKTPATSAPSSLHEHQE